MGTLYASLRQLALENPCQDYAQSDMLIWSSMGRQKSGGKNSSAVCCFSTWLHLRGREAIKGGPEGAWSLRGGAHRALPYKQWAEREKSPDSVKCFRAPGDS